MENLFVPYAIAKLAKKKGFDEPCFCYWFTTKGKNPQLSENDIHFSGYKNYEDSNTIAPIHQQLCDWLLEKHNLDIHAHKMWHYSYNYEEKRMETFYQVAVSDFTIDREERDAHGDRKYIKYVSSTTLKTYKEAIEDGITWALKHIK